MNLCIAPTERRFCKLLRSSKNSRFQQMVNCLILCESYCLHNCPTLRGEKHANNNQRLFSNQRSLESRVCNKVLLNEEILPHYQNSQFFLNFRYFEHTLILTKCLVPCMFTLTDVYYINLILIILPSSCSPLKIFLRSSKL